MNVDDQLRRAMRAAADPIEPPVGDLVTAGMERGRRMRRRFALKVAGGAVSVAVFAAAAAVAVPQLTPASDDIAAGEDEAAVTTVRESHAFDEDVVVDTVLGLLPPGQVSGVRSNADPHAVSFDFVYDDGAGPSFFLGFVAAVSGIDNLSCPVITNGGECSVTTLEKGSELMVTAGPYYPQAGREPDRLFWNARVLTPEKLLIDLGEVNAPTEKASEISRSAPPLSLEQLTEIVMSEELRFEVPDEPDGSRPDDEVWPEEEPVDEDADVDGARNEELAADLGPGWTPAPGEGLGALANPSAENAAGLPEGYEHGPVIREVFGGEIDIDEWCAAGVEEGFEKDNCESTSVDGETVYTQRLRSVADDPQVDIPGGYLQDDMSALYLGEDGLLTRVRVWVAEPIETSTPQRRAAAVDWLEAQLDDLIRAAIAG